MLNMLFPDICPDCEAIDKCGDDCFCPTCRATYYGNCVNSVELEAWTLLAPAMRAIDARWRTDSSGPRCCFIGSGNRRRAYEILRDYEIEINSKDTTYTITTDGFYVRMDWTTDGGYVNGVMYPLADSWKVAQDVDL